MQKHNVMQKFAGEEAIVTRMFCLIGQAVEVQMFADTDSVVIQMFADTDAILARNTKYIYLY